METLPILWARLVKDGGTSARCGGAGAGLQRALQKLAVELQPFGIRPELSMRDIDEATIKADRSFAVESDLDRRHPDGRLAGCHGRRQSLLRGLR